MIEERTQWIVRCDNRSSPTCWRNTIEGFGSPEQAAEWARATGWIRTEHNLLACPECKKEAGKS